MDRATYHRFINDIQLSGNGRNIAGELAAKQGTYEAYIDYLREFPQKYGLTAKQVQKNAAFPVYILYLKNYYHTDDAATFVRFNAHEMKLESKLEVW